MKFLRLFFKPVFKGLLWLFAAAILLPVVAIGMLVVFLQFPYGQKTTAGLISSLASDQARSVTLESLKVSPGLSDIQLAGLEVGDKNGIWLDIDTLGVSWSPLKLFSRTVHVASIEAGQIAVARPPLPSPDEAPSLEDETAAPDTLPLGLKLQLDSLLVRTLDIGESFAGEPLSFEVRAKATAVPSPLAITGDLSLARNDGIDGSIAAKATFVPSDRVLSFDLDVHEPRGGLIAALAQMEGLPALDISLSGSGPVEDWAAQLEIALDGRKTAYGTGRIGETTSGYDVDFDLSGELEPLAPPAFSAFLLGTTMAKGKVALTPEFLPVSGDVNLSTQTVKLKGDGAFNANSKVLEAKVFSEISAGEGALIALQLADRDITFGPLRLGVLAKGALSDLNWSVDMQSDTLVLAEARYQSATLVASGKGAAASSEGVVSPIKINATVDGLEVDGIDLPTFDGSLKLDVDGTLETKTQSVNLATARLTSNLATVDLTSLVFTPNQADVSGKLRIADLSAFNALSGQDLAGAIGGRFEANAWPQDKTFKARIDLTGHDVKSGIAQVDGILGSRTHVSAALGVSGPDRLDLESVSVSGDALSTALSGHIDKDQLSLNLKGQLSDLSRVDPQLGGSIDFEADASGLVSEPDLDAKAQSNRIVLSGTPLTDFELNAKTHLSRDKPTGSFDIGGLLGELPLKVKADVEQSGEATAISPILASLGANRAEGQFKITDMARAVETLDGELTITAENLSELSPLLLTEIGGTLTGKIVAGVQEGEHQIKVSLRGNGLDIIDNSVAKLSVEATVPTPIDPTTLRAHLQATDIFAGSQAIHSAVVTAEPGPSTTALAAKVQLYSGNSGDGFSAKANLAAIEDGIELDLKEFRGSFEGLKTSLASPTKIVQQAGTTTISPLALALGSGQLVVSGRVSDTLNVDAKLKQVPIALANAFSPGLGLAGTLDGTVQARGSTSAPVASWTISGAGLTATPLKQNGLSPLALSSSGKLADNKVTQQTSISGSDGLKLAANGTVGLTAPQPLNLSVTGSIPLASLRKPLTQASLSAVGAFTVSGSVSGNAKAPAYALDVKPAAVTVTSLANGMKLQDVAGGIRVTQDGIAVNSVTANLSTGGSLSASGSVGLGDGMPADLTATIRDGRYLQPGLLAATVNSQISLKGPLASAVASALVQGNILINRADISIPENLSGAVSPVAIQHVNAPSAVQRQFEEMGGEKPDAKARERRNAPPRLDVTVSAPGRIFVRGRGLDAELEGNLRIAGTTDNPQAVGAFNLRRGQLDILTRRMLFSTGTATFSGSFTPVINFVATTTVASTQINVRVSGEASDPEISFTSSPERPQDEVLALLLFGKSVGNLSAIQVAQLAAAIRTLTGGSDNGPLAQIRRSLGLDAIDINTDSDGETSVSVGKYINENIYLGVEQGTGSDSSRVQVDIDLDRGLKLRGEVGADGSSKAGIFFEREY